MCSAWRLASVCHVIITGLLVSRNVYGVKMFVPEFYISPSSYINPFKRREIIRWTQKDSKFFSAKMILVMTEKKAFFFPIR